MESSVAPPNLQFRQKAQDPARTTAGGSRGSEP